MNKQKSGLLLGGIALAVGGGVGIYFLAKKRKESKMAGYQVSGPATYYGDYNTGLMNAYNRQQGMLHAQRLGVPQVY